MSRTRPTLRIAILALSACLLIAVPLTEAHKRSFPASMTASAKNKNFAEGKVTTVPRCIANRVVSIFNSAGVLYGTAQPDAQGDWQVHSGPQITPGSYYAVLSPKRLLKNRRHRHLCRGVRTDFSAV